MSKPEESFQRYLAAKQTVDDRALNRRVLRRLADELAGAGVLRVLNVGAGIGTTLERLLERDVLPERVEYTLVDIREANLNTARQRLPRWAAEAGYEATKIGDELHVVGHGKRVEITFVVADAFEFAERGTWDLLVGGAFLDLFDTRSAFDSLLSALGPGGLYYFPITFDGGTVFEPAIDSTLDARIERVYHDHIDDGGDSHAGRHLLRRACEISTVLAAGSSDWVVHPQGEGYPAEEEFFLEYIVDTVAGALEETGRIETESLADWTETRHRQITREGLVYIAHQLDVLGRVPIEA
ncbi:trans-aconitate 2-methyltransferase [Halococcus sp. IIIV-5B]|uniref:class I SAM-dependent methyltransferase n=1 Tax=Halococcus sp. IIIV-5B TaxID=2321230 RepID=UPI000E76D250|nr:class I SAM-dependent methyltransferase [Halococcus sp. IIIV-5B]RJT07139.1 class I SAM-dependent methyltransferase [Halococcus sp. IIIV-5B]